MRLSCVLVSVTVARPLGSSPACLLVELCFQNGGLPGNVRHNLCSEILLYRGTWLAWSGRDDLGSNDDSTGRVLDIHSYTSQQLLPVPASFICSPASSC